jgi:hypothetical protein
MPSIPLSDLLALQSAEAYRRNGALGYALVQGLGKSAFDSRVRVAIERKMVTREDRKTTPLDKPMPTEAELDRWLIEHGYKSATPPPLPAALAKQPVDPLVIKQILMKKATSAVELALRFKTSEEEITETLHTMSAQGVNVQKFGDLWSIQTAPAPKYRNRLPVYKSRPDNTYKFGFCSDNHLGSKYARLDVLNDLYDKFAEQGVDRVLNAGNWIDGEARFNKHDLIVHGMDAQVRYLVENYPSKPGIVTYAVTGDDHEGWYGQSTGVDIGRYTERAMQDAGRTDWIDMGYMECFIGLVNVNTEAFCRLHLMHPGGGSAYAVSYTVQKIVEGYDAGEKPAVLLAGHYHKLAYNIVRGVFTIQTGTTEDQTPFMRKKKLSAHVGGGICDLTQDPETGQITACKVEFFTYPVREFMNDRWSMSGGVQWADRGLGTGRSGGSGD